MRLLEPTLVSDVSRLNHRVYSRHVIRHLKRHIRKPDGSPLFVLPEPSKPIPVALSDAEAAIHAAVSRQARELDEQAAKMKAVRDQYALRMVATVLRKRAASSLAALKVTINNRLHNLAESAERIEVRRDHLRSLRKGETIPDEDLTQLEIDIHRSFLSQIRSAGSKIRSIEQEKEDLLELAELVLRCPVDTESKADRLLTHLQGIHQIDPKGKVIIFSEYTDTIDWLIGFLDRNGYAGRTIRYVGGDLGKAERKKALADFSKPEFPLLVTTDAASEGLNLQEHCHRVIHYELPFNPNRMLQRQGRVDRYGQTHPCEFAFLYAEKTYEGELLAKLFTKIEKQIKALGSVGDVLGSLQTDLLENLLAKSSTNLRTAIEEAEKAIDSELSRVSNDRTRAILGDDAIAPAEERELRSALATGENFHIDVPQFLVQAIKLADGKCTQKAARLVVDEVPAPWLGGRMPTRFDILHLDAQKAPKGTSGEEIVDLDHRLVQVAIRWIRQTRYNPTDDHRLAARLVADLEQSDLIATFLATVRSGDGTDMEQLLAIRVSPDGAASPEDALRLLDQPGVGNVPDGCIHRLFEKWWEAAVKNAQAVAMQRVESWVAEMQQRRFAGHSELKRQFDEWAVATRSAILVGHDDSGPALPGMETPLPPAVVRRLKEHRKEVDDYASFLDRRLRFEPPLIEPLGVLLRVPAKEAR